MGNVIDLPRREGAGFRRHKSKQDYGTPRAFLTAVEARAGTIRFDLAATEQNCVVLDRGAAGLSHLGPGSRIAEDAFGVNWAQIIRPPAQRQGWDNLWLNPPFNDIEPWACKCAETLPALKSLEARILFLIPASVGSEWWANHVDGVARVLFARPRLSFDGKNPYPKDCALCVYGERPGYECWRWR